MPDDVTYAAASEYAAGIATLAMKGAVTGALIAADHGGPHLAPLSASVAASAVALQRADGPRAEETLREGSADWRAIHSALARIVDRDGADRPATGLPTALLSDVAVQRQARAVIDALDDPRAAKELALEDRNLVESVRDGGDLEVLVRHRAAGAYHMLTPDQQDDVAETIVKGGMMDASLRREAIAAELQVKAGTEPRSSDHGMDLIAPIGREHHALAENLRLGFVVPSTPIETAVAAHARVFPMPSEAGTLARAAALANHPAGGTAIDHAVGIEQTRIIMEEAQQRVQQGLSTHSDRLVASGHADQADAAVQVDMIDRVARAQDVPPLTRIRLAAEVGDVEIEAPARRPHVAALQERFGDRALIR